MIISTTSFQDRLDYGLTAAELLQNDIVPHSAVIHGALFADNDNKSRIGSPLLAQFSDLPKP